MKKLMVIALAVGLALGADAQHFGSRGGGGRGGHGHVFIAPPRVSLGFGYSSFYSPFYSPFGYSPYYGYNGYGHASRPTKLDLQIEDIKNDYKDKIWSAQHDDNLNRKERRKTVHELRSERDQAVTDAKRNYYKY
ncbi:MAG: hypothetical protein ABIU63_07710 [Chitinophagaceae bacterium]